MKTSLIKSVVTELLRYRLDKPVGGSGIAQVDLITADIELDSGIRGFGFTYAIGGGGEPTLAAARALAEKRLAGTPLHHPEASWNTMAAALNRTRRGPNYIALAALDMAVWDAYAKSLNVPLGIAMGGAPRSTRVYGSGGFGPTTSPAEAIEIAKAHVARGLAGVKPRVNGKRSDVALMQAVVEAMPAGVEVMVDANEKGSASTAHRLLAAARGLGILFVEEPLPAEDTAGVLALGRAYPGLIATGEHLQGLVETLPLLSERAVGVIQPDLAMVGGLTEVLRIGRVAAAFGIETAPHFLPGLFVHVACALPTLSWLEEFPLAEPVFTGWPVLSTEGTLAMREAVGHGLALADGAHAAFLVK